MIWYCKLSIWRILDFMFSTSFSYFFYVITVIKSEIKINQKSNKWPMQNLIINQIIKFCQIIQ